MAQDDFPFESRYLEVEGSRIHYVEQGSGDPIVFFHGNPTWSYLWRNILPYAARHGRAIAFDLIGMGRSDKPDIGYTFQDHLRYARGFLDRLGLKTFSIVVHDWGGPLGLTYALENIGRVRSITAMETMLEPQHWSEMPRPVRMALKAFRSRSTGFALNQVANLFVRGVLPGAIAPGMRLSRMARKYYSEPYPDVASRKPVAVWPAQIPFSPRDSAWEAVCRIRDELRKTGKPALYFYASPGGIVTKRNLERTISRLPVDARIVSVGKGFHYLPEAAPDTIGEALSDFLAEHHVPKP